MPRLLVRCLPVFLISLYVGAACAQGDPPGRVGQLDYTEGTVTFSPAGDNEWIEAQPNRPLTRGDRFWTDKGSRAEIQVGSSAVRMSGQTQLEVLALNDQSTQLSVTQGTLYVRVRSLPEGENFEIDTPNLAYRAAYPGDYRVDVDATGGTTRVTIHSGTGAVYGEAGQALPLGGGQQITFRGRSLAQVNKQESPPLDNFDRWALERNRRDDQSVAARYVPRETVGYQQLDAHGQWAQDPTYGAVWFPQGTPANWAPYRDGHWEWIAPWGWTWIDDAPWGFAPSHYGRWAMIHSRWGWVPGRLGLRPIYAPALVAFIGGGSSSAWSIPIAAGRPGVAWFPLAPGEAWQPGFKASPLYVSNVNRNMSPPASTSYLYQSRPDSLTAISAEDFHRGRPVRGSWLRVAANTLTQAQIVPPPPMPDGRALAARERPATARATPPQPDIRQVAAAPAASRPSPQPLTAQREALQQQARAQAAKLQQQAQAEQAKAEQAKVEQAKAEQARQTAAAKSARRVQQAKAKADTTPKRERQARRTAAARPPHVAQRREAATKQAMLAKRASAREEQARRAAQARSKAYARREERARQETHAQRVEQARRLADRDAESLRAQR
jgi:hypothetical protein